eukprot:m.18049 g.18049  ORF g.18049 m.18049 type:complete len:125 (-) comp8239_c0_seq1:104-478(-)
MSTFSLIPHALRKSTGVTGLKRVANSREVLVSLYEETQTLLNSMPSSSAYKKTMSKVTQGRLDAINNSESIDKFEETIAKGQKFPVEQIIEQAEDELSVAKNMMSWKAWEDLQEHPVPGQWKWP